MIARRPSSSRLANLGARAIHDAYSGYRETFLEVTRQARTSFEARDWVRLREDSRRRIRLYREAVDRAEGLLRSLLVEQRRDRSLWFAMKAVYSGLISEREDWDLAETFFNSITRRLVSTVGVDPLIEFVDSDFGAPPVESECAFRTWEGDLGAMCREVLDQTRLAVPWVDLEGDVAQLVDRLRPYEPRRVDVLRPVLFRGKGAFLVGRLHTASGLVPWVVALRNGPRGVFVDATLLEEADVSILFSFTRSAFHVDTGCPWELVRFVESILPRKRRGEIYISLGEPRQGKTELYRELVDHLERSGERFCPAVGTPGLVMVVFTVPGLEMVLKVIRDRFPPEKDVSPARVRERYQWVYDHDRAGRIVDAQPYEDLSLPARWFEPDLLEELLTDCGRTVRADGDQVVLHLAYLERRVRPLDLFVRESDPEPAAAALLEYGDAIRELAACNIFPGDLLLKNFGVTRHGRVAFYDYDEVTEVTSLAFRHMPVARSYEEEMSAEPWFSVGAEDVFPEEWVRFLGVEPRLREVLLETHGELFDARWWRDVQKRIRTNRVVEFPPYREALKLHHAW